MSKKKLVDPEYRRALIIEANKAIDNACRCLDVLSMMDKPTVHEKNYRLDIGYHLTRARVLSSCYRYYLVK